VDEIILFSPLSIEEMEQIVDLQLKEIQERLDEHGVHVILTEPARKWLAKTGYDPAFGARPLKRALQKFVESPLSVKLLGGEISAGTSVSVVTNEAGDGLEFKAKHSKKASAPVEAPAEAPAEVPASE
jgi:ATP-dependent Clp protease ATP-binding subunit ClpC